MASARRRCGFDPQSLSALANTGFSRLTATAPLRRLRFARSSSASSSLPLCRPKIFAPLTFRHTFSAAAFSTAALRRHLFRGAFSLPLFSGRLSASAFAFACRAFPAQSSRASFSRRHPFRRASPRGFPLCALSAPPSWNSLRTRSSFSRWTCAISTTATGARRFEPRLEGFRDWRSAELYRPKVHPMPPTIPTARRSRE